MTRKQGSDNFVQGLPLECLMNAIGFNSLIVNLPVINLMSENNDEAVQWPVVLA